MFRGQLFADLATQRSRGASEFAKNRWAGVPGPFLPPLAGSEVQC